jgi:maltose/moltooligosaccharide transporter
LFFNYLVCDFTIIFKTINKIDEIKIKFWQIINMNVGFFAFSIVLVCNKALLTRFMIFLAPVRPVTYNLAGLTGLLIQPIIGAMSDKTWLPKFGGRRKLILLGHFYVASLYFSLSVVRYGWQQVCWVLDAEIIPWNL